MICVVRRLTAGSVIAGAFALLASVSGQAQESGPATLIVQQRLCETDNRDKAPFEECGDVVVGQSFSFTLDGQITQTVETDAATGDVTFGNLPGGRYELSGGIPGEFAEKETYCQNTGTGQWQNLDAGDRGVLVDIPGGAEIVCQVYEFPTDLSGGEPGPVTALPETGIGSTTSETTHPLILPIVIGLFASLGLAARSVKPVRHTSHD